MTEPPLRDEPLLSAGLAGHLQRTAPDEACPDAEQLAVYAEAGATPDERARLEAHLASCVRCQAHLIALVESAPPEASTPAPSIGGFWLPWKWLVPIASAALVAVAVWVSRPSPAPLAEQRITLSAPQAAPAPSTLPEAEAPVAPPPAASLDDRAPRVAREAAENAEKARPKARPDTGRQAEAAIDALAKAAPEAPKEIAGPSLKAEARAQAAAPAPAPAPAPPPPPPQAAAADRAGAALMASPATAPAWRLVNGAVERSRDADAGTASGFKPEGATLRAIAGVSPRICWAVGDEGVVYRTTDGTQWARVTFPERVRLISVQATDALHAEVVADDGRRFATDDGGATWRALPSP